ncbi:MAG: lytic murein transglycosylase [Shimia sp.]|uniref:lytic murein transglycosylase n=1 Tax=Shimia sp. TaxID=1954381 RepID=UPI00405A197C
MRAALLALTLTATTAVAEAPISSPRPVMRPELTVTNVTPTVAVIASAGTLASRRPVLRPDAAAFAPVPAKAATTAGLQDWISTYRARALSAGISGSTFDRAFVGVRYNSDVIKRDRNQSEFTKTIWDYLDSAASDLRVKNGKAALAKHKTKLTQIERKYGVDKEVVVAIWGLESAYGTFRGSTPIIGALATLAYDGRRGAFFEEQLTAALKILQTGDVRVASMTGSWAGAMGHTQFMPTSFLSYAVDFTGDGKRDIWSDDPTDALASTAAYLKNSGWIKGQPWGVEVRIPDGFDYTLANRETLKMPSEWARIGFRDMAGRKVPNHGRASILLPAGAQGAAFMIFKNFDAIETYNTADAYVIGVGHLSDRIKGGAKIQSSWPRGDRALTYDERIELQERLTKAGFDTQKIDAKIGPLTINAVRDYQLARGMTPDGYASLRLLQTLR